MATETTNLHLAKPSYEDLADVSVINDNMDTIDAAVGGLQSGLASIRTVRVNFTANDIAADSYFHFEQTITPPTGTTPIGIVYIYNSKPGQCVIASFYVQGNVAHLWLRNESTTVSRVSPYAYVLCVPA